MVPRTPWTAEKPTSCSSYTYSTPLTYTHFAQEPTTTVQNQSQLITLDALLQMQRLLIFVCPPFANAFLKDY